MVRSTFESLPLTIKFVSFSDPGTHDRLPDGFSKNFRINSHHIAHVNSLDDVMVEDLYGGIVALCTEGEKELENSYKNWKKKRDEPIERVETLQNPKEQHRFVNKVYGYYRWENFRENATELSDLIEFHSFEKFTLMAHDPPTKQKLGHMLANPPNIPFDEIMSQYFSLFQKALRKLPTKGRHFNVLEHLYGYLSELLPGDEREHLLQLIRDFRDDEEPLIKPLTELKKQFDERSIEWVSNQSYLNPKSEELDLKREIENRS